MVLRGPLVRPRQAGRVPQGAGRPGERARRARPRRRAAGLPQRLPAPRRAAVHRGRRRGQAQPAVPVPRLDVRPGRPAGRRAQPDEDARRRPGRSTACTPSTCASGSATPGCAWPTSRRRSRRTVLGAAVERLGDLASIERYEIAGPRGRPADHVRRQGQLEAHHRELHGVLPLRDDPPRAHRGAAGVRRRLRGAVLRRARRGVRRGRRRASPSTAPRGSTGCRASPTTRTAATTRSPSSRRCSSTWCPTT